jgi:pimeloyl-ACP methyl ester carboxylesterase
MNPDAATSHFITAPDGLKLHVHEYGKRGGTALPVVCLPGLTRNVSDFETLAAAISAGGRRVIALDSRGRGRSDYDPDPARYSLPVELGDVIAMLMALQCEPAVFVGTSRGGLLTMLMAAVRPAAIAGAVLNDIGPVIEVDGLRRIASYVGKMPRSRTFEDAAKRLGVLFGPQFPKLTHQDWIAWARRTFRQDNGALVLDYDIALAKGFENFDPAKPVPDLWPQFEALKAVPVMAIRGAYSDLLSEATVEEMARRHTALETLEVPDQGHAPLLAEADVIARIAAFVGRCEAHRRPGGTNM